MRPRLPVLFIAAALVAAAPAAEEKPDAAAAAKLLHEGIADLRERAAELLRPELPAPPDVAKIKNFLDRGIADAAAHPRPLRVQGVVTCAAPDEPWIFIQDDTAGMMVMCQRGQPAVTVGQHVTAEGRTAGGQNAPFLINAVITPGGQEKLPVPLVVSNKQVERQSSIFGQWVETEGVVRDAARTSGGSGHLLITSRNGSCSVILHGDIAPWLEPAVLETRVRLRGVCWKYYGGNLQIVPGGENLTVLERSPATGMDRAPVAAASLKGRNSDMPALLRGVLQHEDALGRWRVLTADGTPVLGLPAAPIPGSTLVKRPVAPAPGTQVDIEGRVAEADNYFTMHHMWARSSGPAGAMAVPVPVRTSASGAGSAAAAGHLLTVSGRVIAVEEPAASQVLAPYATVPLASALLEDETDGSRLHVLLPRGASTMLRALPGDRLVDVTGWQVPASDSFTRVTQIWPESEAAVRVAGLTRATVRRNLYWGAGGLGVLLVGGAGFLWALREKLRRQRREAAIIAAHAATLEARVAERTAELAAANERLSLVSDEAIANLARERELGDLKSSFVSMVSHEFRTPLAVILSSTDILSHHLERLSPERRAQQLAGIRGSTQQMARLIEEVLLLGKVEAGKMAFAPEPVNLRGLCSELVDEALSATARRCPIILRCAGDLPESMHADAALLRHIFTNLLSNASRYSAEGTEITLHVEKTDHGLVFQVVDHGIGIPPEDQARIFEPFHRAKNVGQISGTGLGLMITKRCVELHGGTITLHSAPDEGTTVEVRLPLITCPSALNS